MPRRAATTARKQPRQERSRATVDVLLAATARVLVRDGYDRASTNRIAQAAGVSIGSLYQYFPSKEAIVAALVDREVAAQVKVFADKLVELGDAPLPVAVRGLVEAVVASHAVHPKLQKVLSEEVPRVGGLKRLAEFERMTAEMVAGGLLLRRAELRTRDFAIAAFVLTHAVDGVLHAALQFAPGLIDEAGLVDELVDLVLRYIVADERTGRVATT